jgi:hypothetical protein
VSITTLQLERNVRLFAAVAAFFTLGLIPAVIWLGAASKVGRHELTIPESGLPALAVAGWCLGCGAIFGGLAIRWGRSRNRVFGIVCCIALFAIVAAAIASVVISAGH